MALTRDEISNKYGTACIGGICRSNTNKCYTIIINPDTHYTDIVKSDGTIDYMGQDGGASQGNNRSLNNTDWPLHVYHKIRGTRLYAYIGQFRRHGYAYEYTDRDGKKQVMFVLRKECSDTAQAELSSNLS